MKEIDNTLKKRNSKYGSYEDGVIMTLIKCHYRNVNEVDMDQISESMISDVVNKLVRIAVTPTHIDSWHDIQGYSKLIENYLRRTNADKQRIKRSKIASN